MHLFRLLVEIKIEKKDKFEKVLLSNKGTIFRI
jgi:hypothetical protein